MSLTPIPEGHVGAVVTYLEMTERPEPNPLPHSSPSSSRGGGPAVAEGEGGWRGPLSLVPWPAPDLAAYRLLFERVGARWLWFSRLAMDDTALRAALGEVHVVTDPAGAELGLVELDFGVPGECLIRFLGFVPELAGLGHGQWLFARTLALAWRPGVGRVHVNTCSLDHPAALPSYLKAGFRPFKRAFESFPDPRLGGFLAADAAPGVPLIGGSGGRSGGGEGAVDGGEQDDDDGREHRPGERLDDQ